jgi:hypothetical protein
MKPGRIGVKMFGSTPGRQATRTVPLGTAIAWAPAAAASSAAATTASHCVWTARPDRGDPEKADP